MYSACRAECHRSQSIQQRAVLLGYCDPAALKQVVDDTAVVARARRRFARRAF
jgi:hypothetical protein